MRCLLCESFSLSHICNSCQELYLTPKIYKRKILDDVEVISFYKYNEIKELLFTKHTDLGFYIYKILAQNSLKKFAKNFSYDENIVSIAIDDNPKGNYSHTAILNHSLKSNYIKPLHNKLRAKNHISYSGKNREFRILNPRDFELKEFKERQVIVVDDIVTTGLTLTQAVRVLKDKGKEILFCLTLADASLKS